MRIVRQACLSVAAKTGVFSLARQGTASRPRILAYHGVTARPDDPLNFDGFFVPVAMFEAHLRTLAGHYRVLPLGDLAHCLREGRAFPPRSVCLTFDDGYRDNATLVAPLLARYGLRATFFLTTGFLDGTARPWWFDVRAANLRKRPDACGALSVREEGELKNLPAAERRTRLLVDAASPADLPAMMSWDDVRALVKAGHEIGIHTVTHPSMAHESPGCMAAEIRDARERIRVETGVDTTLFAYPYGGISNISAASRAALAGEGITAACTTIERWVAADDDALALPRINVSGGMDRLTFRARMAGLKRSDARPADTGQTARR